MESLQGFETWFFGGFISILLLIIAFFLKKNLERMETKIEILEDGYNDHETRIQLQEKDGTTIGETLRRTNELLTTLQIMNAKK